jgi:hypothetical protein
MKTPKFTKPKLSKPKGVSTNVKAPKPVADLYADLRDRRLLPLVLLLVVAIVAVPFLLADKDSTQPTLALTPPSAKPTAATFAVVPAKQELRDPGIRFKHGKRVSPFSSYAAAGVSKEQREEVEGVVEAVENGGAEVPSTTETVPPPTETETAPESQPGHTTVKATLGTEAVIKTGYVESEAKETAIPPQTRLPKPENPVVVYTGPSKDGQGALFLMTNSVSAYYGSGKCVLGGEICQVLELRQGKSATFAVGFGETRYKVTLLGFVPIVKEGTVEGSP